MSGNVDERVVGMTFDNGQFKKNAADTITTLDSLKKALNMDGAKKGLDELSESGKRFSLAGIADGVQGIVDKFKLLSIVGITALVNLANKAVDAGLRIAKSLTIDPIKQGFQEYETQLNAIQTILANTSKAGTSLKDVNGALAELNEYSDKTIYNFTEMTRNIGTFTAAGIGLEQATSAIKGIANLAAVSGSNSQQASTAMYQLSQAMAAGTVKLQDWNSVVNAGMGGKVFQDALVETARVHGVKIDEMLEKEGGFRNTLQKGWLSSSILTETLAKFTGDLSDEQLKQMGYTKEQIKEIQAFAVTANDAATKVKTFSQLMETMKEAVGSGWSQTWTLLIGDFDEAKKVWTDVSNTFGEIIQASSDARNQMLGDWKQLGGRTVLIYAIKNAFNAVMGVIKPIKEAFQEIFPPMTGKRLYELTQNLAIFTNHLKMGEDTVDKFKRTFKGLFAFFSIMWQVVKGFLGVFTGLFKEVGTAAGGVLSFTARVGDWLVRVDEALKKGTALKSFFSTLAAVIQWPIDKIKEAIKWFQNLFNSDIDTSGFTSFFDLVQKRLAPIVDLFKRGAEAVKNFFTGDGSVKKSGGENPIVAFINGLSGMLKTAIEKVDYDIIFDALSVGLIAGLIVMIRKFIKTNPLTQLVNGLVGGLRGTFDRVVGSVTGVLDQLTSNLKAMQQQIKAKTLLMIAGAVALLAASAVALSMVDSQKLAVALGALTVMFANLVTSMAILDKSVTAKGVSKFAMIGAALILVAIAIDILTIAVVSLSKLSWEELAKGISAVTALMAIMVGVTLTMSKNSTGMMAGALALVVMSGALVIMATALKMVAGLSWEELARGLIGITVSLAALIATMKLIGGGKDDLVKAAIIFALAKTVLTLGLAIALLGNMDTGKVVQGLAAMGVILTMLTIFTKSIGDMKGLTTSAVGLLIIAAAMKILVGVVQQFAAMSWEEMGRGLAGMAGALVLIGLAMRLLPSNMLLSAASLVIVAYALTMIGDSMQSFGGMDWGQIGKALVMLAGSLLIIAGAMYLMTGALPGAAALIIVAGALTLLVPVLQALGAMEWGEIGKGLVALAGVFLVLGVAALVLTPVVPVILALGIAIGLLGIGLMAVGAAVLLFALGMTALAALGATGAAALTLVITAILSLIPLAMQKLGEGIAAFAKVIAESGPIFVEAMTTLVMSLLNTIWKVAPKIQATFLMMITRLLDTIVVAVPKFVTAAVKLIAGILKGIGDNIGKVIDAGANLIVQFLKGIGRNAPKVLTAAADMIIDFLNGIADTIDKKSAAFRQAGLNIAKAIIKGMTGGLTDGVGAVVDAAKNMAGSALDSIKGLFGIHSPSREMYWVGQMNAQGLANAMVDSVPQVSKAAGTMGDAALEGLKDSMAGLSDTIDTNMELQPVITPVLDLSAVRRGANEIDTMVTAPTIDVNGSYSKASTAAAGYQANQDMAATPTTTEAPTTNLVFNQTNNSPKPLNEAEIYRQSKNVIGAAKGALEKNAG